MAAAPLITIVGPTASGKTVLAIELADQFDGEIICADSRTIYKGMDIGTAKPTAEEQDRVPHWGIDLVTPGVIFTAADFKRYATEKIDDIRSRGKVPFLVGGTGLYVDGILFDYQFATKADQQLRQELDRLTIEELYLYCQKNNIQLPNNSKNKRYIIRAIEKNGTSNSSDNTLISNCFVVGIATDRAVLRTRIENRSEQLFANGVVGEAKMLGEKYGWDSEAMTGNIYPLVHDYLVGDMTIEEMKRRFITLDWRLAKRQMTWLKRNQSIEWYGLGEARQRLSGILETWRQS